MVDFFVNLAVYDIIVLAIGLFLVIATIIDWCKEDKKVVPMPIEIKKWSGAKMPKYYIGAKVKIREYIVREECLGWLEFRDHLDDEFEVTEIFNTVDRGISYRIHFKKKIGHGIWTFMDQVVPEHYLCWSNEENTIKFWADDKIASVWCPCSFE